MSVYSLALVPLKSASRASISSSEPSAFSMTLRPPDLLEGTKEVSFPRLRKENTRFLRTEIAEAGRDFLEGAQTTNSNGAQVLRPKATPPSQAQVWLHLTAGTGQASGFTEPDSALKMSGLVVSRPGLSVALRGAGKEKSHVSSCTSPPEGRRD